MRLKESIINLINKLPHIRGLHQRDNEFRKNSHFPPGHFYSPIISVDEIRRRESEIWNDTKRNGIAGIELRTDDQILLVSKLAKFYDEIPFKLEKQESIRYYYDNNYYLYSDAIILYSMMRHFRPAKIIEIGSGFSSAVMLDTNEFFFKRSINFTFIEPYPERLFSVIKESDKQTSRVIQNNVQSISLDIFAELEPGDILFVDSTHVAKTGSDVNYILFEILPILKSGVLIHFHDIFYPFEYIKEWVLKGYNWNEAYFLRAFLSYNTKFEIKLFSEYLHRYHKQVFKDMPLTYVNTGGSLWLEKK
jgi:Methyltransferase domain